MYRSGTCSISRLARGELGQRRLRAPCRPGRQAGGGQRGDVRAGVGGQQPEQSGRGGGQFPVGTVEHGAQVGRQVAGLEDVEGSAGVPEPIRPDLQGELRVHDDMSGDDDQGQRQAHAAVHDLPHGG